MPRLIVRIKPPCNEGDSTPCTACRLDRIPNTVVDVITVSAARVFTHTHTHAASSLALAVSD
eukprot:12867761-Heterocapsa_arctica.AAC.1